MPSLFAPFLASLHGCLTRTLLNSAWGKLSALNTLKQQVSNRANYSRALQHAPPPPATRARQGGTVPGHKVGTAAPTRTEPGVGGPGFGWEERPVGLRALLRFICGTSTAQGLAGARTAPVLGPRLLNRIVASLSFLCLFRLNRELRKWPEQELG